MKRRYPNSLVKKNYNAKISDAEKNYFNRSDYNKSTHDILDTKIKEKGLVDKFVIAGFINNDDLNKKVAH